MWIRSGVFHHFMHLTQTQEPCEVLWCWNSNAFVGDVNAELRHANCWLWACPNTHRSAPVVRGRQRPYNPGNVQTEDKDHRSVLRKPPAIGTEDARGCVRVLKYFLLLKAGWSPSVLPQRAKLGQGTGIHTSQPDVPRTSALAMHSTKCSELPTALSVYSLGSHGTGGWSRRQPSPLLPIKAYPQWPQNLLTSQSLSSVTSVQSLSRVRLPETPWTAARQASLSITNSRSPPKPMSIESVMPSNHLILCCPFSSCRQSFPASRSFPMNQFFLSGGPSNGASASVLPMNIQDWSPLEWTGWISFQPKGLSRVFSNTTVQKHQFFGAQLSLWSNSHIHTWLLEKP